MIRGNFEILTAAELNDLTDGGDHLDKLIGDQSFESPGSWDKFIADNKEAFETANNLDQAWIKSPLCSSLYFRQTCIEEGFKILSLYPIYHQGWECDYWGALGEKNGKTYLLETNHGGLTPYEIDPSKIKQESLTVLKITD